MAYCEKIDAGHIETSAKTGMGVEELFYNIAHSKFS